MYCFADFAIHLKITLYIALFLFLFAFFFVFFVYVHPAVTYCVKLVWGVWWKLSSNENEKKQKQINVIGTSHVNITENIEFQEILGRLLHHHSVEFKEAIKWVDSYKNQDFSIAIFQALFPLHKIRNLLLQFNVDLKYRCCISDTEYQRLRNSLYRVHARFKNAFQILYPLQWIKSVFNEVTEDMTTTTMIGYHQVLYCLKYNNNLFALENRSRIKFDTKGMYALNVKVCKNIKKNELCHAIEKKKYIKAQQQ